MKLSALTIYIIGFFFCLAIVSYGAFYHMMPNTREAQMYREMKEKVDVEAGKLSKAKERREDAIAKVKQAAADWRRIVAVKTPPQSVQAGGIDLAVHAWQLSVETRKFRNNVQRAVNKQLLTGGVEIINGPYVPGIDENTSVNSILASYYNVPPYPFPVVIYDLGSVTVAGTYEQIKKHVKAWSSMPRYLAVTDALTLNGTSPRLTATYNLQIVGFIRANKIAPPVKEGQASATGGGGASPFGGGSSPFGPGGPAGIGGGRGGPGLPAGIPGGIPSAARAAGGGATSRAARDE